MHEVRLALAAMATRFELVLWGKDPVVLRAAGEEVLTEIARLEQVLSFYRPTSELSYLNRQAGNGPVRVSARLFALLQQSLQLHVATEGAFDVTIGPLMRCWGFAGASGSLPIKGALQNAMEVTGMQWVELDEASRKVRYARPGVEVDLGAVGKGFAIEEAAMLLRELGINSAFLHGGTSSMVALGTPPDQPAWNVAIANPTSEEPAAVVALRDEACSVSAPGGKAFRVGNQSFGHVIDPRTGHPVKSAQLAAVVHNSATSCDALATGMLVLGNNAPSIADDSMRSLVLVESGILSQGITPYVPVPVKSADGNMLY